MTDWPIVGLTGALVLITGYYAWQNKRMADQNTRMVQELQKQREAMAHQLREMRIQTQLGLYRPRLAVMRGVRKALSYVARDAKVSGEVIAELIRALGEKEFLFGAELCRHLDEIYQRCVKASTLRNQLTPGMADEQRRTIVTSEADELRWILDQLSGLRNAFSPYLQVDSREGS